MATRAGMAAGKGAAVEFRINPRLAQDVAASPEVRAILTMLALRVTREARRRAPVDTGRLRNSITHRVGVEGGTKMVAEVGTNVEYAPYQEFGTSRAFTRGSLTWGVGQVPATRFLGGALQTVAQQLGGTM